VNLRRILTLESKLLNQLSQFAGITISRGTSSSRRGVQSSEPAATAYQDQYWARLRRIADLRVQAAEPAVIVSQYHSKWRNFFIQEGRYAMPTLEVKLPAATANHYLCKVRNSSWKEASGL